jgi:5'-3' exoribonuclease 1
MGVPGFYRWLVQRYPYIRRSVKDPSRPRITNLFVDVNGIFYSAVNTTKFKGTTVDEVFMSEVRRYIDLLVQITRPSGLIFLAVDGPAPVAKACQQRTRRFVSARDMTPTSFDRTVFSPGTTFMTDLNDKLQSFVQQKKQTDAAWQTPTVIFSSCFVPGEGEHKILDYIRKGRAGPDWDPNQVHVMYSNDADVIFLALQTHEPYFCILRDADASAWERPREAHEGRPASLKWGAESFEYLHISMVRDYMSKDFGVSSENLERTIDDFVGIAFLIGNDFVPDFHDIIIQKGGFNNVVACYKAARVQMPDAFLVEGGKFVRPFQHLFLSLVVGHYNA